MEVISYEEAELLFCEERGVFCRAPRARRGVAVVCKRHSDVRRYDQSQPDPDRTCGHLLRNVGRRIYGVGFRADYVYRNGSYGQMP